MEAAHCPEAVSRVTRRVRPATKKGARAPGTRFAVAMLSRRAGL